MSSSSGRGALLVAAAGALIGVPVILGSLYNTWQITMEAREESRRPSDHVGASVALPPSEPPRELPAYVPPPNAERPLPEVVAGLLELELEGTRIDDFDPTLPYRLTVEGSDGMARSATVDLGRDGTIDEWWTLRPEVSREVLQDGARRRLVRRDGEWVPE